MKFSPLLSRITPHRSALLGILVLLFFGSIASLLNPWMAGLITASVMGETPLTIDLPLLFLLWGTVLGVAAVLSFATQYTIGVVGERVSTQLRNHLYQHMLALPLGYYQQRRPGETLTLLDTDANCISGFVTETLVQLLPALFTFAGALFMMANLDGTIALLALTFLPVYFFALKLIARYLRPLSTAWIEANSRMFSVLEENLSMLPAIKAFTREKPEQSRFERANAELLTLSVKQYKIEAILYPAAQLLGGIGLMILLWLGLSRVGSGHLATSELISLLLYARLMTSPMSTLAGVYGEVQQTLGSAERLVAFLNEQPEPVDSGTQVLDTVTGQIRCRDVCFSHPGRKPILQKLKLDIEAGETVAITGENGVGKTTLVHLLMRFTAPTSGQIFIDGTEIRRIKLDNLRHHIGLMAQHVLLVNGTVAENIAYAGDNINRDQIERASKAADAHSFISSLPQGYDTVIGDQGVRLSGGQRQRLSLARTLLKDPPILLLDEATAMFDPLGETAFLKHCREALAHKTVILITHRPASLALADRVLELRDGKLIQRSQTAERASIS